MKVWKLCIALIREYGLFSELRNLDFSSFVPLVKKNTASPVTLKDGTRLNVDYRELDKVLRTIPDENLAVTHSNFSTSTSDPINDKPVKR